MPPAAFLHPENAPKPLAAAWGFAPDPTGGAYSAPSDSLAELRGLLLRGEEGSGGEGRGGEGLGTLTMLETD